MHLDEETGGTSEALTVTEAGKVFAGLLSQENKSEATTPKPGEDTPVPEGEDETEQTTPPEEQEQESETDEEKGEEDEIEQTPAPKTFKVKVDGAEHEVTEDELLKGYSRQQDYTRKTTELSEQRKAVATESDAIRVDRAAYADQIAMLKKALETATPAEPNWPELAKGDAEIYKATRQAWDEHSKRMTAVSAEEKRAL